MYVFGSGRRGWSGCEWMRGLGFTNPVGVACVSMFVLQWVVDRRRLGPGSGEVGWCYVCEL